MTLLSSPNAFIYMYVQYKSFLYTRHYHISSRKTKHTINSSQLICEKHPLIAIPFKQSEETTACIIFIYYNELVLTILTSPSFTYLNPFKKLRASMRFLPASCSSVISTHSSSAATYNLPCSTRTLPHDVLQTFPVRLVLYTFIVTLTVTFSWLTSTKAEIALRRGVNQRPS